MKLHAGVVLPTTIAGSCPANGDGDNSHPVDQPLAGRLPTPPFLGRHERDMQRPPPAGAHPSRPVIEIRDCVSNVDQLAGILIAHGSSTSTSQRNAAAIRQYRNALLVAGSGRRRFVVPFMRRA